MVNSTTPNPASGPQSIRRPRNLHSIDFIKRMNEVADGKFRHPHHRRRIHFLVRISRARKYLGEAGFSRWNMGWMNDTLKYFSRPSIANEHNKSPFLFTPSSKAPLAVSTTVVHGKTLFSGMPGDLADFANLRLLSPTPVRPPSKKPLMGQNRPTPRMERSSQPRLASPPTRFHRESRSPSSSNHLYARARPPGVNRRHGFGMDCRNTDKSAFFAAEARRQSSSSSTPLCPWRLPPRRPVPALRDRHRLPPATAGQTLATWRQEASGSAPPGSSAFSRSHPSPTRRGLPEVDPATLRTTRWARTSRNR